MPQQARQSRSGQSRTGSRGDGPTYQQLYADAKRRGIQGRSKMNKAQLQQALKR